MRPTLKIKPSNKYKKKLELQKKIVHANRNGFMQHMKIWESKAVNEISTLNARKLKEESDLSNSDSGIFSILTEYSQDDLGSISGSNHSGSGSNCSISGRNRGISDLSTIKNGYKSNLKHLLYDHRKLRNKCVKDIRRLEMYLPLSVIDDNVTHILSVKKDHINENWLNNSNSDTDKTKFKTRNKRSDINKSNRSKMNNCKIETSNCFQFDDGSAILVPNKFDFSNLRILVSNCSISDIIDVIENYYESNLKDLFDAYEYSIEYQMQEKKSKKLHMKCVEEIIRLEMYLPLSAIGDYIGHILSARKLNNKLYNEI